MAQSNAGYLLWTKNPWLSVAPQERPTANREQAARIDLAAAQGEFEPAVLMVTNLGRGTLAARVLVKGRGDRPLQGEHVELRQAVFVKDKSGSVLADPLPLLNEMAGIVVPPGRTLQVWLTVSTHHLAPGEYEAVVQVSPLDYGVEPQELPLRIKVYPVKLPAEPLISAFTWDRLVDADGCIRQRPEKARLAAAVRDYAAYVEDMCRHGVNVFFVERFLLPWPSWDRTGKITRRMDFSLFDEIIRERRKRQGMAILECTFSWGLTLPDRLGGKRLRFMGPVWEKVFRYWFRNMVAHLKELGLTYQDYAFYFVAVDGVERKVIDKLIDMCVFVREIDPKVKLFVDYGWVDPECRNPDFLPAIKRFEPYADILAPLFTRLENPEELEFLKGLNKPVWPFFSSHFVYGGPNIPSRRIDPYSWYRLLPWRTWKHGFDGCAFCGLTTWSGKSWDLRESDCSAVYEGTHGPVPSRRWEAFREGLEDYKLLYLLNRRIARMKDANAARQAKARLDEAVDRVLAAPTRPEVIYEMRRTLLQQLTSLGD